MGWKRNRRAVIAVTAACALMASACGRSASGANSPSGNISPTSGLVATTPAGSIMCTGAYMLKSWTPGVGVVAVRNPQAGDTGKTLTIGTSSQLSNIAAVTGAYQAAAQAIGLKVVLRSVPAQNYIDFFTDPQARQGVDGFPTVDFGDDADPAAMLATFDLPGGLENYDNFNDPKITAALEQARSTASPDRRAALVVAEKLTVQQLPWIPDVKPTTVLLLGKGLTGAVSSSAYLFSPWADNLGGTG